MSMTNGTVGVDTVLAELLVSEVESSSVEQASNKGIPNVAKTIGLQAVFKKERLLFIGQ